MKDVIYNKESLCEVCGEQPDGMGFCLCDNLDFYIEQYYHGKFEDYEDSLGEDYIETMKMCEQQ